MKIKHIETSIETKLTYNEWLNQYVKKGKYKKYEILESEDIVELHRILEDGSVRKSVFDINASKDLVKRFPNEFTYIDNTWKYCNKYLVNIKSQKTSLSFLNKVKYTIKAIILPIKRLKPIWRFISLIIIAAIGGFFAYLLIEYYKNL